MPKQQSKMSPEEKTTKKPLNLGQKAAIQDGIDKKRREARRKRRRDRKDAKEYHPSLYHYIQTTNPLRKRIITPKVYRRPTDDEIHPAYQIFVHWSVSALVDFRKRRGTHHMERDFAKKDIEDLLVAIGQHPVDIEKYILKRKQRAATRKWRKEARTKSRATGFAVSIDK